MLDAIIMLMTELVGASHVAVDEPMSKHTTFKIGGRADLLIIPQSIPQLKTVIKFLKQMKVPYFIMGNGSNLLVGDKGIRGAVIKITGDIGKCDVEGTTIVAESGIMLARLANTAYKNGLSGLEFVAGIPGTLGGAIYMNAGAYGGEMKNVVESVTYLDKYGNVETISGGKCQFGYRHSIFSDNDFVILSCRINLKNGEEATIKAEMDDLSERRISKQPLNKPSAGSTFKRPEGYFAGKLIQDSGLKGYRIGGAMISEKHSGFVINEDKATANDVVALIRHVQAEVKDKFGVDLDTEVKSVGEF
ncbi:MAG: UDP-N-acetylmuramate dehydrogenase [Oscillospiraceae bacterium]